MPVATARKKKASDKEASKEVEEERVMTGTKEVAAMAAAFDAAQKSVVAHRKGVRELRKVQEHMQFDDFAELLQGMLGHTLSIFKREACVDRVIDFVIKFLVGDEHDPQYDLALLNAMVLFLVKNAGAKDKAVRFRVCQIVAKILHAMPDDAELDEALYQVVQDTMLNRLIDKIPAVREKAVLALCRLQDPESAECPIMERYLERLAHDSSPEVRRTVLMQIAVCPATVPAILQRTMDKAPAVRRQAYKTLAEKVDMACLSIADRMQVLKTGLEDRVAEVRQQCITMIVSRWLSEASIPKLLSHLDVENETAVCEKIVTQLLKSGVATSHITVRDFEQLDCERALLWRTLYAHLQATNSEEHLDSIVPEVSQFAHIIAQFFALMESATARGESDAALQAHFIIVQLLRLGVMLDYADEVGRRTMGITLRELLLAETLPASLVPHILALVSKLYPTEDERIQLVAEIVSDIREPLQKKVLIVTQKDRETQESKSERRKRELKVASLSLQLMELRDAKEQLVKQEDYAGAEAIKKQMEELELEKRELTAAVTTIVTEERVLKDDDATWLHCLSILESLLEGVQSGLRNSTLAELINGLALTGMQKTNPALRNLAVKCLGLAALLDKEFATRHVLLFLQVAQVDMELLQKTALMAMFDMIQVYGMQAFQFGGDNGASSPTTAADCEVADEANPASSTTAKSSVLPVLIRYLDHEDADLRTSCVEGFARLLISGRLASSQIFSRLLILYFNPTTEDDKQLRQCLSVFFPAFAFSSLRNQEVIHEAFYPTLNTIFLAPPASPVSVIKATDVAQFMVYMTSELQKRAQVVLGETIHEALAIKLANEVLSEPNSAYVTVLCKILSMLQAPNFSPTTVKLLRILCEQILQDLSDPAAVKLMVKFQEQLVSLDRTPNEGLHAEQLERLDQGQANLVDRNLEAKCSNANTRAQQSSRRAAQRTTARLASDTDSDDDNQDGLANVDQGQDGEENEHQEVEERDDGDTTEAADDVVYEVQRVLKKRRRKGETEYLVRWLNYTSEDDSWEPAANLPSPILDAYEAEEKAQKQRAPKKKTTRGKVAAGQINDNNISDPLIENFNANVRATRPTRASRAKLAMAAVTGSADEDEQVDPLCVSMSE